MLHAFEEAWDDLWPLFAMGLGLFAASVVRVLALRRGVGRVAVRDARLVGAAALARGRGRRAALEHARYRHWLGPARALPTFAVVSVGWALVQGGRSYLFSTGPYAPVYDQMIVLAERTGDALALALTGYAVATLALGLRAAFGLVVTSLMPAWSGFESDAWRAAMRSPLRLIVLLFGVTPCIWLLLDFVVFMLWGVVPDGSPFRGLPADVAEVVLPTDCFVTVPSRARARSMDAEARRPECVQDGADVVVRADDDADAMAVVAAIDEARGSGAAHVRVDPRWDSQAESAADDRRVVGPHEPPGMEPDREPDSSAPTGGAELADGRDRAPCIERPEPRTGAWAPGRRYWLEMDGVAGLDDRFRVVVCTSEERRVVARIDPNPGGAVSPSFEARLTAGDRVLMQWGCGTNCSVARLVTVTGEDLQLRAARVDVSPDGEFGVAVPDWIAETGADVSLVDLRTGRASSTRHVAAYPRRIRWTGHEVTVELEPPDGRTLRFRTWRR